ncbi:rRNA pseudouridine synthase [Oxynema sp. CENA135]|uniref:pseudouridine synthase n=1 Tax=Oxynema sp. CENA135 TaxID=984206 RepID=UPI00190DED96|nr:rRNA pseudouridine synthase [Oxynema sp. CENA135]
MEARLQKILSQWGIASRRQAEQMILDGRVRVNGRVVPLGVKANPHGDRIEVDGVPVRPADRPDPIYLLLHKPKGVVSTCSDPQQRTTVLDLLPSELSEARGLHPVGRLDYNSTGALLLTNDGDLTFSLTHPRHSIAKTYQVWVKGHPPKSILHAWQQGVPLDGKTTRPASVRELQYDPSRDRTLLEVVLREGRNRQIRRVAAHLGYPVVRLHRSAIGPIHLGPAERPNLSSGQYRHLTASEIDVLRDSPRDSSARGVRRRRNLTSTNVPAKIKEHGI